MSNQAEQLSALINRIISDQNDDLRHDDLRLKNKINNVFIFVFPLANNNQRTTTNEQQPTNTTNEHNQRTTTSEHNQRTQPTNTTNEYN